MCGICLLLLETCLCGRSEFSVYGRIPVVGANEGNNSKCFVWCTCKTPPFTLHFFICSCCLFWIMVCNYHLFLWCVDKWLLTTIPIPLAAVMSLAVFLTSLALLVEHCHQRVVPCYDLTYRLLCPLYSLSSFPPSLMPHHIVMAVALSVPVTLLAWCTCITLQPVSWVS